MGSSSNKQVENEVILGECKFCPKDGAPSCAFCGYHFPTIGDIRRHQSRCKEEIPKPPTNNIFKPLPSWNSRTRERLRFSNSSYSDTYISMIKRTYDRKHSYDLGGCQPSTQTRQPPTQVYQKPINLYSNLT
jgi:hypothetical protein